MFDHCDIKFEKKFEKVKTSYNFSNVVKHFIKVFWPVEGALQSGAGVDKIQVW